jgi:hypothetical protein
MAFSYSYERTVPLRMPAATAVTAIQSAFVDNGFSITMERPDAFDATGPGMNSTGQHPLLGISTVTVFATATHLTLRAELGALRRMQYMVLGFPSVLILLVCTGFHCLLSHGDLFVKNSAPSLLLTLLTLGFFMGLWLHHRTSRALDLLLERACQ